MDLGEWHTSCIVESAEGMTEFPLGTEIDVILRLMFVEEAGALFHALTSVGLFEGSRKVATGVFLDGDDALADGH